MSITWRYVHTCHEITVTLPLSMNVLMMNIMILSFNSLLSNFDNFYSQLLNRACIVFVIYICCAILTIYRTKYVYIYIYIYIYWRPNETQPLNCLLSIHHAELSFITCGTLLYMVTADWLSIKTHYTIYCSFFHWTLFLVRNRLQWWHIIFSLIANLNTFRQQVRI